MSNILERLRDYTAKDPDAVILYDETHTKGISYAQLDDMSGRVYAYLKNAGLGKEDFVLINLPRGVLPVIAMIGVWKAGAAWALVEDTYAPDRIAYIRSDCGCKAEINAGNWDEVMHTSPLSGFEEADDHDAAYAGDELDRHKLRDQDDGYDTGSDLYVHRIRRRHGRLPVPWIYFLHSRVARRSCDHRRL